MSLRPLLEWIDVWNWSQKPGQSIGFPENFGNSNFGNLQLFLTSGGDRLLNETTSNFSKLETSSAMTKWYGSSTFIDSKVSFSTSSSSQRFKISSSILFKLKWTSSKELFKAKILARGVSEFSILDRGTLQEEEEKLKNAIKGS